MSVIGRQSPDIVVSRQSSIVSTAIWVGCPGKPCWRLMTDDGSLTTDDRPSPLLYRQSDRIAPLGPRAIVIPYVVEAKQVGERRPGMGGALANAAVGDRVRVTAK